MQKKGKIVSAEKKSDTTVKTYTHFLIFTSFLDSILTFPLLSWVLKMVVSFWLWWFGCYDELSASGGGHCREYDDHVDSFFFPLGLFHLFLHIAFSSLVCSSTPAELITHGSFYVYLKGYQWASSRRTTDALYYPLTPPPPFPKEGEEKRSK